MPLWFLLINKNCGGVWHIEIILVECVCDNEYNKYDIETQRQIQFVYKIINHIEQNDYMENVASLQKPPFDKPVPFVRLFDSETRSKLMHTINDIKNNAVDVIA